MTYKFRARWRATALTFMVDAKNYAQALKRAERAVKKMEGGDSVIEILFVE